MDKDEVNKLLKENYELRTKQVLEGLSSEEQRKLERTITALNGELSTKHQVDINTIQLNYEVKLVAMRNIIFEERPVKQTVFQKLAKKEKMIVYDVGSENPDDVKYDYYTYGFALAVRDFMTENGIGNQWTKIIPPAMDMEYEFVLDKSEMEWIKNLPDPKWCLQTLNDVNDLEENALQHGEDMYNSVNWLKERWAEGYQIYIDYTELTRLPIE